MVPAVLRALNILELFISTPTLSTGEITARLRLPKTTTHTLVKSLVEREYLVRVDDLQPHRYKLGVRAFELGSAYGAEVNFVEVGHQVAQRISGQVNETVQMAILDQPDVIPIVKVDSERSVRLVSSVGRRTPAHCTAVGKCLLAGLSEADFDALYGPDEPLKMLTEQSLRDAQALRRVVADVRRDGIAREYCESNEHVACVGAPIKDGSGRTVAALSLSVPIMRWSRDADASWAILITEGAREISRRIGYNHD